MLQYRKFVPLLIVALALILSACNLSTGNPAEETIQAATSIGSPTGLPTRTPATTSGAPTPLPLTTNPTQVNQQFPPTAVVVIPATVRPLPTNTFVPVNIVILSPVPGNVVAGGVTVFGSATHPNFLQYQLEYGPDPNPGNLWYPANAAVTIPVSNNVLGYWNTQSVPDGVYALRLRVFLRDGTLLTTVVNNVRVQNQRATPVPSAAPQIERPIAAFNVNASAGQVPLSVTFTNQSSGQINSVQWTFGDGTSSNEANPTKVFNTPGLYTVTLTVSGPGGTANVSRQISAQSPSAPIAGFTLDRASGVAPLRIQFTDQSTGQINQYAWNFLDGTGSNERSPAHTFDIPGTYNVLLTVTGPGGSSTAVRQITVTSPIPPTATWTWTPTWTNIPPTFTWTPTETWTNIPPTLTWTPTETWTNIPPTLTWTPTETWTNIPPTLTWTPTETWTNIPPTLTWTPTETWTNIPPTPTETWTSIPPTATETPPIAAFTFAPIEGSPLSVQFMNQSSGNIGSYQWNFGDGTVSNEVNPVHPFALPGTYNVQLVVISATDPNARGEIVQQVTVSAPPTATLAPTETPTETPTATLEPTPDTPSIVMTTPVLPDIGSLAGNLSAIYQMGLANGNFANVFSTAGDDLFESRFDLFLPLLNPFADATQYTLGENGDLQAIIDFYNAAAPLAPDNALPFAHESFATGMNWRTYDLLDAGNVNPDFCAGFGSPLACELQTAKPVVMLISVGITEAEDSRNPDDFRQNLQEVIDLVVANGTIPVLMTTTPRNDGTPEENLLAINEQIIDAANDNGIPVINVYRQLSEIQNNRGLDGGGVMPSVSPNGGGNLFMSEVQNYGVNAINLSVLRTLNALRQTLYP